VTASDRLGIGATEMVCFVGAGGKSTLLLRVGSESVRQGRRVVLTTTTKMSPDQIPGWAPVLTPGDPVPDVAFLVGRIEGHKVLGVDPGHLDALFSSGDADHVLIEADGARRRTFKAPAEHEPVIPSRTTLVVVIVGMGAVGNTIAEAAHRPERVTALTGVGAGDRITAEVVSAVMTHPQGGLRGVPEGARVAGVLTGVTEDTMAPAARIEAALTRHPRYERVVMMGPVGGDRP
jgi:probable selenium-dependent hydroxylase accessory protein YqeC